METFIKSEPIDYDEIDFQIKTEENFKDVSKKNAPSFIESQFESEQIYINNINCVLDMNCDDEFNTLSEFMPINNEIDKSILSNHVFNFNDAFMKVGGYSYGINKQKETELRKYENKPANKVKSSTIDNKIKMDKIQLNLAKEKKRILTSLLETAKEKKSNEFESNNHYEPFGKTTEARIFYKLNNKLNDAQTYSSKLKRFRCKLELRRLKRKKHMKLFDIDSYVNELLDREKISCSSDIKKEKNHQNSPTYSNSKIEDNEIYLDDDDTLQKVDDNTGCEIIAVKRVLDRFKSAKSHMNIYTLNYKTLSRMPIGIVQCRNDDVKCIFSPFTDRVLKPYIRRDYESLTKKIMLNFQITTRNTLKQTKFDRHSIDYVHLRPEHVIPINIMCEQHFWSGIDISECLQYPDYTMVALYRKLIIGFAFLVPNVTHKESYLSFIFVHPDWRNFITKNNNNNATSIAQYMLYYLIQINKDHEISLHVSVNSPAVLFYQKFSFQIEEFIENFYDKYYSDTQNLSKDAFIMRLNRS